VLNNALHLLVDEFDAAQTRLFQTTNLSFHQQLETHFGNEQGSARSLQHAESSATLSPHIQSLDASKGWEQLAYCCISDRGENIELRQFAQRINAIQHTAKSLMKNVSNSSTATSGI
jgi:hypothetical protein